MNVRVKRPERLHRLRNAIHGKLMSGQVYAKRPFPRIAVLNINGRAPNRSNLLAEAGAVGSTVKCQDANCRREHRARDQERAVSNDLISLRLAAEALYCFPMIEWSACPEVEQNLRKVSGAWIFRGSRVPVTALFENLEAGASIDDFLSWFPGVTKAQVEAVLEYTISSLESERLAA